MSHSWRAVGAAVVAGLLATAWSAGAIPAAIAVAALIAALAIGWPTVTDLPHKVSAGVVIGLAGAGAGAALMVTKDTLGLAAIALAVGFGMAAVFIREIIRHPREDLTRSVIGCAAGATAAALTPAWLAIPVTPGGRTLVVAALGAVAMGCVVAAVPLKGWASGLAIVAVATAASAAVVLLVPTAPVVEGVAAGFGVGLVVAAVHVGFKDVPGVATWRGALAAAVLPAAVTGVLVYYLVAVAG